jgi:23S rRNA pseudouridine1911/1915/1917 synthase
VAARTPPAFTALRAALSAGALEKRYLSIVESAGLPGSGLVDFPIFHHARDARRVTTDPREGRPGARAAVTEWHVVRRSGPFALVELCASPARRHQVRAHLATIGHPIVNDALYGGQPVAALGARHALHASYVAWAGDGTLAGFAVEEALPPDLLALL